MKGRKEGLEARTRTLPCRVLVSDPTDVEAIDRYGSPLPDLPVGAPKSLLRGMFVDVQVEVKTNQPCFCSVRGPAAQWGCLGCKKQVSGDSSATTYSGVSRQGYF